MGKIQGQLNNLVATVGGMAVAGKYLGQQQKALEQQEEVKKLEEIKTQDTLQNKMNEATDLLSEAEQNYEGVMKERLQLFKKNKDLDKRVESGELFKNANGNWRQKVNGRETAGTDADKFRANYKTAMRELDIRRQMARTDIDQRAEHWKNVRAQSELFTDQTGLKIQNYLTHGQKSDVKKAVEADMAGGNKSRTPIKVRNYGYESPIQKPEENRTTEKLELKRGK